MLVIENCSCRIEKIKLVHNEVVKNTKFNTLKTKISHLEKNISDATTLIHINQYNTKINKILRKKNGNVKKKIPDTSSLVTATVLSTKVSEAENKIPDHAKDITTQEFNKLI